MSRVSRLSLLAGLGLLGIAPALHAEPGGPPGRPAPEVRIAGEDAAPTPLGLVHGYSGGPAAFDGVGVPYSSDVDETLLRVASLRLSLGNVLTVAAGAPMRPSRSTSAPTS